MRYCEMVYLRFLSPAITLTEASRLNPGIKTVATSRNRQDTYNPAVSFVRRPNMVSLRG